MRHWRAVRGALVITTAAFFAQVSPAAAAPPAAATRDYDCADFASQAEAQERL